MRRQNTSLVIAALVVLIIIVGNFSHAQDEVPCTAPARLADTNGASWSKGANITVIINPTDFPSDQEQTAIKAAFTAWQNANPNAEVKFSFTTGTQPAIGDEINTHYVRRGNTQTGGYTNIGFIGELSTTGNITQSAVTTVDPSITCLSTITNMMLHEIGHTFGLADCWECEQGSSIMSTYRTDCFCPTYPCDQNNFFNGMRWGCPALQAPRRCEVETVAERANYPPPPTPTSTPTPTPTPCAQLNQSCYFSTDCCAGTICGNLSYVCVYCEPNPQDNHDRCMSERCRDCYGNGGVHCTGEGFDCWTPIVVDVEGDGFHLTDADGGVYFNDGNGTLLRTAWTAPNSDDAWLVLDHNNNGIIDDGTELFGNAAAQPFYNGLNNGFRALNEFDKASSGGNQDGYISSQDSVFSALRLWQDKNHDGISSPAELHSLASLNVASIHLKYKSWKFKDANGNTFKFRAKVEEAQGAQLGRWVYDVFLDAYRAP